MVLLLEDEALLDKEEGPLGVSPTPPQVGCGVRHRHEVLPLTEVPIRDG